MANITTTGTTGYPSVIDTRTTLVDGSSGDEIVANHPNGLGAAVLAIQTELGTLPKGSYADVKTRLNALDPRSGTVVQFLSSQVKGVTTTAVTLPFDNTPPQSTEGNDFGFTINILPTSTLNSIYVQGSVFVSDATASDAATAALFVAGSTSAVTAFCTRMPGTTAVQNLNFLWKATSVSVATTSYNIRIGPQTAGTLTLNGEVGAGLFGDTLTSTFSVFEVQN